MMRVVSPWHKLAFSYIGVSHYCLNTATIYHKECTNPFLRLSSKNIMESRVSEGQAYAGYAPQQQAAAYWYPPQQQGYGYPPPMQGGHWYPSQQQGGYGYPPQVGYGYPPSQQGGYGYPPQGVVQPEQVNNFSAGLGQGLPAGWELFGVDMTTNVGERVAAFVDGNADNCN